MGLRGHLGSLFGVCGPPVRLEVLAQVLAGVAELVLVQNDVKALRAAIRQLLGNEHLRVHELGLCFSAAFDQPTQHLQIRNLDILYQSIS